ncbi:heavy metal-responsive transcriptional regulator [Mycobacteroides saopaulense]|uniref:Mercuric resistance operon regulatory protein n=1 Tax=Mycobacteroides saopaulense TaxID=1578165 RepID=A0A1S4VJP3_9MYCO|nr:MerR family transcriptional regulator [Mycobacteroides saopaulense]ALR14007.1 transcriptional regulator [Mycobacteroides saopaulense]ORB48108.1 heavy metal-responsive transcriptional regulator [Mycobacteroides saopaulense]
MRSGEVASEAGVSVQTVRYYERRGLLSRPPRSSSGYRAYPVDAVEVVRFVKRAQEHGFTLDEVDELLQLADGGPEDCQAARDLAQSKIDQLAARAAELNRMMRSLTDLVDTCDRPRKDRSCPLVRTLNNEGTAR